MEGGSWHFGQTFVSTIMTSIFADIIWKNRG